MSQSIGIYGMGVMGQNIALNFRSKGADTVVFNRTTSKTDDFMAGPAKGSGVRATRTIEEFVRALPRPRTVLLMIEAGPATDKVIDGLAPLLEEGDTLIDGGNSWFEDTERRSRAMHEKGLRYMGMGVSGGEEGALKGPSLMPGGDRTTYEELEPLLRKVAAQGPDGPCVTYLGPGGAGHLVKMVHNGIEYGDMQLICEAYDVLRHVAGLGPEEMAAVFRQWNQTELQSYLIEITATIVNYPDDRGDGLLLDRILDAAGQKGTGRWTVGLAARVAAPIPTIAAAVDARVLSAAKAQRVQAAEVYGGGIEPSAGAADRRKLVEQVRQALLAAKICSYAQGMSLLRTIGEEQQYDLDYGEIARIWQAGCIIRARFLKDITDAFRRRRDLPNLLMDDRFAGWIRDCLPGWRATVGLAVASGLAAPAMSASLAYFDSYRRERLPAYLLQAQRDFFGAHTYKRVDQEGTFHTEWPEMIQS